MIRKGVCTLLAVAGLGTAFLSASFREGQCRVFYRDGGQKNAELEFLSSRSGQISFYGSGKEAFSGIWMLNFSDENWNFPQEQSRLNPGGDTVVYRDGRVDAVHIFSWSTNRRVFYLKNRAQDQETNKREIPVGAIARVYFGGNRVPEAFRPRSEGRRDRGGRGDGAFRPVMVEVSSRGANFRARWEGFDGDRQAYQLGGRWYGSGQVDRIFLGRHDEDLNDDRLSPDMTTVLLEDGRILQDRMTDVGDGRLYFENLKPLNLDQVLVIAPPSGRQEHRRQVRRKH